jgi:hypothetical protein
MENGRDSTKVKIPSICYLPPAEYFNSPLDRDFVGLYPSISIKDIEYDRERKVQLAKQRLEDFRRDASKNKTSNLTQRGYNFSY